MDYNEIMFSEMRPDLYDGEKCNEVHPRWWSYADGDMDGDYMDKLTFNSKDFPPGTRVIVSLPCCPKCCQASEMCIDDENCNFDWDEWRDGEYS